MTYPNSLVWNWLEGQDAPLFSATHRQHPRKQQGLQQRYYQNLPRSKKRFRLRPRVRSRAGTGAGSATRPTQTLALGARRASMLNTMSNQTQREEDNNDAKPRSSRIAMHSRETTPPFDHGYGYEQSVNAEERCGAEMGDQEDATATPVQHPKHRARAQRHHVQPYPGSPSKRQRTTGTGMEGLGEAAGEWDWDDQEDDDGGRDPSLAPGGRGSRGPTPTRGRGRGRGRSRGRGFYRASDVTKQQQRQEPTAVLSDGRGQDQLFGPSSFAPSLPPPIPSPPRQASRSPSPRRTIADLSRLQKPVRFTTHNKFMDALPDDSARNLYRQLKDIEFKDRILPSEIDDRIRAETDEMDLRESMWRPAKGSGHVDNIGNYGYDYEAGHQDRLRSLIQEFEALLDISFASREASDMHKAEPEWNDKVHSRILELALGNPRLGALVEAQNVTTARIARPFIPTMQDSNDAISISSATTMRTTSTGARAGHNYSHSSASLGIAQASSSSSVHKMVDYALVLRLDRSPLAEDKQLLDKIDALLLQDAAHTINQSTYGPLCRFPCGIVMETKTKAGTLDKAQLQLGVWTAAWHNRMQRLCPIGRRIITLPLITVVDSKWTLSFVVDEGSSIDILQPAIPLGDTASITGLYQLLAGLRVLSKWVRGPFREWIAGTVGDVAVGGMV